MMLLKWGAHHTIVDVCSQYNIYWSHCITHIYLMLSTMRSLMFMVDHLVGGLEHFSFSHILGTIIPIDFHIFQMGGSTTNQSWSGTCERRTLRRFNSSSRKLWRSGSRVAAGTEVLLYSNPNISPQRKTKKTMGVPSVLIHFDRNCSWILQY